MLNFPHHEDRPNFPLQMVKKPPLQPPPGGKPLWGVGAVESESNLQTPPPGAFSPKIGAMAKFPFIALKLPGEKREPLFPPRRGMGAPVLETPRASRHRRFDGVSQPPSNFWGKGKPPGACPHRVHPFPPPPLPGFPRARVFFFTVSESWRGVLWGAPHRRRSFWGTHLFFVALRPPPLVGPFWGPQPARA